MKYLYTLTFALIWTTYSCSKNNEVSEDPATVSDHLNYSIMENWAFHPSKNGTLLNQYNLDIAVINENLQTDSIIAVPNNSTTNTGVDVFFVHPTVLSQINDPPQNIVLEEQSEFMVSATILTQAGLMAKYGRFFAPRYRQSTGTTYRATTSKELQASIITVSYNDVKAAFMDYLTNYNNGNKIILAGHSQGSFLLAMLLRDVFDNDEDLKSKLVTAALGGIGYVYAAQNSYVGGWWQNIPLCTAMEQCGCIHNWRSFDEKQSLPEINTGLPEFNPNLIDQGLVYRTVDQNQDWFVQDSEYYGSAAQPLRYYIVPNQQYNLSEDTNFIAFDKFYHVRVAREGPFKVGLNVELAANINDQRPDDLADEVNHPNYDYWGYHRKDYNIYLWALLEQIDLKLQNCK